MLSKMRWFVVRDIRCLISGSIAAVGFLLSCVSIADGQDAVPPVNQPSLNSPVSSPNPPAPAVEINPVNESNIAETEAARAEGYSPQPRRFQYGLLLRVRGVYDDNINVSRFNRVSDYYFAIEPTITLGLGDIFGRTENYIRLDYTPSVFLFLDHSEDDAVQHLIRLEGHHRFRRLDLTVVQEIQIL